MTTLTPWFEGKIHKPVRPGVYQVRSPGKSPDITGFRNWNGETWSRWYSTAERADSAGHSPAPLEYQSPDWRGVQFTEALVSDLLVEVLRHLTESLGGVRPASVTT